EVHRFRVTAVLAADADLQRWTGGPALVDRDPDQPAHAFAVDRLERRDPEDAKLQVPGEERAFHVVAGEAPTHLGEVVSTEGEELGCLGDLPGGHRRPRHLDHRADQRLHAAADIGEYLLRLLAYRLQLLHRAHQRYHDLRLGVATGALHARRGLGDRTD